MKENSSSWLLTESDDYNEAESKENIEKAVENDNVSSVDDKESSTDTTPFKTDFSLNIGSLTSDDAEDEFLAQIDEFREKAKQLQALTVAKQNRMKELDEMVSAKELENKELEAAIDENKKIADAVLPEVTAQVDKVLSGIDDSMSGLKDEIKTVIKESSDSDSESRKEFIDKMESVSSDVAEKMGGITSEFDSFKDELKDEIFEKIHSESVTSYRHIKDTVATKEHLSRFEDVALTKLTRVRRLSIAAIVISAITLGIILLFIYLLYSGVIY